MTTLLSPPHFGRLAQLVAIGLLVAGCSSNPDKDRPENPFKTAQEGPGGAKSPLSDRELRQQAGELYRHAREALNNSDYAVAITRYDALISRYPFSDYSTQAELEKIYAQYKSFQSDDAVTAADRFLRAHPRHPSADYVMYLKGVTDFDRDQGVMEALVPNSSKRDIGNQRRAFEDFALLLQRYPNSKYIGDARRRMLYSRNRIADHELSVAEFYVTRGAYVAAAKRATDIITEYPGAPATADALKILERSYAKIGLDQEAKDTATLIAMNTDKITFTDAPKPGVVTAPVVAAVPPPAAAQTADAGTGTAAAKPGFMSRFTHAFDIFDTSKPENQHVIVIGNSGSAAAAPATGTAAGSAATTTAVGATAAAGTTAAAAPATTSSTGLSLKSGFDPAVIDAANKDQSKDPAKEAPKPADQTQAAAPQEKKGFFSWFAGLFSFADSDKHRDPPAPAVPPASAGSSAADSATPAK